MIPGLVTLMYQIAFSFFYRINTFFFIKRNTVLPHKEKKKQVGDRAFPMAAAWPWNSLPEAVRRAGQESDNGFTMHLKTW